MPGTIERTEKSPVKLERIESKMRPDGPVPNTIYSEQFVKALSKFIYLWAWPMVNVHNRCESL